MSTKSLSIVIPTYNRAKHLDSQISWAIESIDSMWDKVELIICDNASTDNTPEVCSKWRNELGKKIAIYRNESNVGLVKNCFLGIERANGKFVWLVGDDDKVDIRATSQIINVIESYENIGLIHINHRHVSALDGEVVVPKFYQIDEDIYAPGNGASALSQILMHQHTGGLMFVTANIMNKEMALRVMKDYPPEKDLLIVYPMLLNASIAALGGFYYIAQCIVDCSAYLSSWRDQEEYVHFEGVPKALLKLKNIGITNESILYGVNYHYSTLHSFRDIIYLMRNDSSFLKEKKFQKWIKRISLKRRIIAALKR